MHSLVHVAHVTYAMNVKLSVFLFWNSILTFLLARWGNQHPEQWYMCSRGKQQSPINIEPDLLLYDSNLGRLVINSPPVSKDIAF